MIEWYVDSHACSTNRVPGSLDEGKIMLHRESFPGQVPYGALLPESIDNLLVPVCVSATHVTWNTVRLEATWMHIGESAAYAVVQAMRYDQAPAQIDRDELLRTLTQRRVMLAFFNDIDFSRGTDEVMAAQYFATKGYFTSYDARLEAPLKRGMARVWINAVRARIGAREDTSAVMRAVHAAEQREDASVSNEEFAAWLSGATGITPSKTSAPISREGALRLLWAEANRG